MKHITKILATAYICSSIIMAASDERPALRAYGYGELKEIISAEWKTLLNLKTAKPPKKKVLSDWITRCQSHATAARHLLSTGVLSNIERPMLELFIMTVNFAKAIAEHESTLARLPEAEQNAFAKNRPTIWKDVHELHTRIVNEVIQSPRIKELLERANSASYQYSLLKSRTIELDDVKGYEEKIEARHRFLLDELIPAKMMLTSYLERNDLNEQEIADANFIKLLHSEFEGIGSPYF